ncbi:XrtA/PEP-CTERM system histidine kinase PrsK [Sedimenticola sp.]|uniref:XrtA/PEP-CTERM system histidine kinase PrsK n=1 Tax=Sedimenticola sp. TaxID=1940285 RepID=UPI003D11B61B
MNIGFISYLFAFIAYTALTGLLITSWRGRSLGRLLILASSFSALWAGVSALSALTLITFPGILQLLELGRDTFWCLFLLKSVQSNSSQKIDGLISITPINLFSTFLAIASVITVLIPLLATLTANSSLISRDATLGIWVAFNIIALLLLEQLFRNSTKEQRWAIKHLCIGIGCIFAYDFFMFADALLFKQLNLALWNARGIVNGLMVPLIAISVARNPKWSLDIYVSRNVVFQSITLMGAGIYLLVMASAGYYIRFYGGSWGSTLQIAFLSGTGALLLIILFSGTIRAKVRVFLSKHFFNYKYDYREEWLRFTQTLADTDDEVPVRVVRAMSALVNSTGGSLWIKRDTGQYEFNCNLNMPDPILRITPKDDPLCNFLEKDQWLIDLDEYKRNPDLYSGFISPSWLTVIPNAWLVVPLLFKAKIFGFIIISRSQSQQSINWEDRDLLKMAGQQAASHLAQHLSEKALTQARQFEAFNRLSAYVVHDLKNILAQQSLIVSNSEKHKHKPEFVDDVIETVRNSVKRMTNLMEQMKSGMRGHSSQQIDLNSLLSEVSAAYATRKPIPKLNPIQEKMFVHADKEQLATVFGHIIQNAQDATPDDGHVIIGASLVASEALIEISDDGCGMDPEFIKKRLFHPFDSTKGLTGMGIGVYESREYIRSLNGEINVKSTPGEGSVFCITLPAIESIE